MRDNPPDVARGLHYLGQTIRELTVAASVAAATTHRHRSCLLLPSPPRQPHPSLPAAVSYSSPPCGNQASTGPSAAPSRAARAARSSRSTKCHCATDAPAPRVGAPPPPPPPRTEPEGDHPAMSLAKRYVLRLFISLKYVTANVVDRQSGRIVVTASSVEKPLRDGLECGRTCNAKAAAAVGEVLAMRLKVDGLAREPIHAAAAKEVEKKGFKNRTKVWAILNALRDHGVNLRIDDDGDHRPHV